MQAKRNARPNRQVTERACTKHNQFTRECIGAVALFMAAWAFGTFGLGHIFGVI